MKERNNLVKRHERAQVQFQDSLCALLQSFYGNAEMWEMAAGKHIQ